jgi:hypothetical protein
MRSWARSREGVDVVEEEPRIETGYPDVDNSIVGCDPIDIENLKNLGSRGHRHRLLQSVVPIVE